MLRQRAGTPATANTTQTSPHAHDIGEGTLAAWKPAFGIDGLRAGEGVRVGWIYWVESGLHTYLWAAWAEPLRDGVSITGCVAGGGG